ncbi:MAG: superinfection immunity protein [Peptoniphilaceae bacterium]|uniref:superinfection immunity protein n=2 Tax=Parvimonas sp. TaxID=1944660 RepID=UPI002A74AE18|nr:superinfection immunity protein [Parvimonas sp.]MDD7764361.1 superinfection immunity protein [Peptoniphilaceae bacterium]MDY3050053.1 superinfection immunity protein [Parvimonas sp.]
MKDEITVLYLTKKIYSSLENTKSDMKISHFDETITLKLVEKIDVTDNILNGLQAAAYLSKNKTIFLIVRGADVGIGKKLFKSVGAKRSYIPLSTEKNQIKTTFQDWIYSSIFGSIGLVHLYQYDSLTDFFKKVKCKYPKHKLVIGGLSLGGLLSQKIFLTNQGIDKCITFSTISPWWTFNKEIKKIIKSKKFYYNSKNIKNYYSKHDLFRFFPLFSRQIGKQIPVILKPYKSKSNIIASILERICWAHIPNYYYFDKKYNISIDKKNSIFDNIKYFLGKKVKKLYLINSIIILLILSMSLIAYQILQPILILKFIKKLCSFNDFILNVTIYSAVQIFVLLPTIISKTRWKFIIFLLNLLFGWTIILWPIVLSLSIITNDISNE